MIEIRALLLAAGIGSRLWPLTSHWPKCLMPVSGKALLEHWLCSLYRSGVKKVLVNVHHHQAAMECFLRRQYFSGWVASVYEPQLLGTAGTLIANAQHFDGCTTLLAHADNWCHCDFRGFLDYHRKSRPDNTLITMMTFRSDTPSSCGVVELDDNGVVRNMHEKVDNPPSNLANGAVYLIEPPVLDWLTRYPTITDFSTEVIPHFFGRIATWENQEIHRDIGVIESLLAAQKDSIEVPCWVQEDQWQVEFSSKPIHKELRALSRS